jgi:hypothetical protein
VSVAQAQALGLMRTKNSSHKQEVALRGHARPCIVQSFLTVAWLLQLAICAKQTKKKKQNKKNTKNKKQNRKQDKNIFKFYLKQNSK